MTKKVVPSQQPGNLRPKDREGVKLRPGNQHLRITPAHLGREQDSLPYPLLSASRGLAGRYDILFEIQAKATCSKITLIIEEASLERIEEGSRVE